ncbi:unnamed protein product [Cladocopium goreaui]|uniref:Esterase n=1 Tax=Cladocopium goreaui TaxID=2562237 RepID=A0A9P1CRR3_9DINO|nr:unnamed protein product [Cladocopium goreaui]
MPMALWHLEVCCIYRQLRYQLLLKQLYETRLRQLALKYFQGDATRLKDPLYSPFHATEEQLDELPPIYLAVSGSEVLTGDSMIFAQRAAVRGVRVYISMFPGMWHGFPQYIEGKVTALQELRLRLRHRAMARNNCLEAQGGDSNQLEKLR